MGKNEKTELGRALMKHHNQMIQQSKEKGRIYRNRNKKILESVTDVSDIEAIIEQAEESERLIASGHPLPNILINLDTSSASSDMTPEERRKQQKEEEALYFRSLRVPRRPPWNTGMSMEELDANERRAFLEWRRSLARLEENEKLVLTPFEKNLDIWRQLWRVIERSDLLVMVVDARDPLFYRCSDLEAYAREVDEHKRTLLLVNKADLLPLSVRKQWAEYFSSHDILFVFWSAKAASAAMEGKNLHIFELQEDEGGAKIYGRDELLARLQTEAERISTVRRKSEPKNEVPASKSVVVGFVGYPNVGKSSTINALVGQKRTGVTSTPGKTKHFQTLIISDELTLCDCPGLVFPSFSSSRYEMVASGVLPIDRMTEQREAVRVVAERVPRRVIEAVYNITLPKPKPYEPAARPPLASELLRAYCASRGHVASSGLPDETRAARQILKDYIDGKLPHYESPPRMSNEDDRVGKPPSRISNEDDTVGKPPSRMSNEDGTLGKSPSRISNEDDTVGKPPSRMSNEDDTVGKSPSRISNEDDTVGNPPSRMSNEDDTVGKSPSRISNGDERVGRGSAPGPTSPANHESDSSDAENRHGAHILERVLHDLDSFDVANGLSSSKKAAVPEKAKASHKQHKKPQRKKNRSWRVGNDDGDGMPVVRVFQKPANACPLPLRARQTWLVAGSASLPLCNMHALLFF